MDKRTELEIQRDKYEAVIEERDALISSLRGENEKLKRDLESERGFYREKVSLRFNKFLQIITLGNFLSIKSTF